MTVGALGSGWSFRLEFRARGLGFSAQGLGCSVRLRVWGSGFRV